MGLNYTYSLYFEIQYTWNALQGSIEMAEKHHPPTLIHFPDHDLDIPRDYVLFKFDTPGSNMSILFMESPSIRTVFIRLLEKYHGVCGVFNLESLGGELFWFWGQTYKMEVQDAFITPNEIEKMLK